MKDKINDGGPAFPTKMPALDPSECGFYTTDGMTLRDWFAGMALQGIVSNPDFIYNRHDSAKYAYEYADEMIQAREVKK